MQLQSPDGKSMYSGERESNGKYTFNAPMSGMYKYCFGNKMSSMTPKLVMFSLELGEKHAPAADGEGDGVLTVCTMHEF